MMEEEVPSASPRGGTTRRQQATHTRPPSSPQRQDDDDRTTRRNRNRGVLMNVLLPFIPVSLSPTHILSKLMLLITVLLKLILSPLVRVSHLLFPPGTFDDVSSSQAANRAAGAFVSMLDQSYIQPLRLNLGSDGNNNDNDDDLDVTHLKCPFVPRGYSELVSEIANKAQNYQSVRNNNSAAADSDSLVAPPLLLIYLHSPLHGKVPSFLSGTLLHPSILKLLHTHTQNGTLACWGGSVHTADGANVQNTLQVNSYPFLALVRVQPNGSSNSGSSSSSSTSNNNNNNTLSSGGRNAPRIRQNLELHFRMEGPTLQAISTTQIHTYLSHSLTTYQNMLSDQAMRRLARLEEIRLREEQDREYREALEEDRRREREREDEARRVAEEIQRQKDVEEEKVRLKQEKVHHARMILGEEPPPQSSSAAGKDGSSTKSVARIRLMLPSGRRLERRFWGEDTIDVVRAFLTIHFEDNGGDDDDGDEDHVIRNFQLSSNYPKKALVDGSATLESEGLCPQAVIMVQDLDA